MKKTSGIYIHVPFCTGKCYYCDFYSEKAAPDVIRNYISALRTEIAAASEFNEKKKTDTLYFGGGTPSLLSAKDIGSVIETVYKYHDFSPLEVTLEGNPDLNLDFNALKTAGINRVSFGVQSFDDKVLKAAGRRHTAAEAQTAIERARKVFDNISLDIMLGLPKDTVDGAVRSASIAAEYADHVSMYMLKLEEGTPLYNSVRSGSVSVADEDETVDAYDACMKVLESRGLFRYEVSNFAKKGYESVHNLKYWDRNEYFGFGAAAHGFIAGSRYFNPYSVKDYIDGKNYGARKVPTEFINKKEAAAEAVILALRKSEGLYIPDFNSEFSCDFTNEYASVINESSAVAEIKGDYFKMKEDKLLFESAVARLFI